MREYIIKRVLWLFPVMFLVSFFVFCLIRLTPGDVVMTMLAETGNVQDAEALRRTLGLDKPIHLQYLIWVGGILRGDLGQSLWTGQPVLEAILSRLPVTLELAVLTILVAVIIALPVGILSAVKQDTFIDYIARVIAMAGLSMPNFWLGTLAILLPVIFFRWSPRVDYVPFLESPGENLVQMLIPAVVLGYHGSASAMRMTRATMLEVLRMDYIRTAWSKGLTERVVIYRHALKNALIPVLTIIGLQFSRLLGGTVIVETIFSLPGVGRLTIDSVWTRDYPQLQANVLMLAMIFVIGNLIVDIAYSWLDPRIRYA